MVLESIVSPESAQRNPLSIIFLSFIFVTVAVFATLYLSAGNLGGAGMLLVALVALPSLPMMLRFFEFQVFETSEKTVLGSHTLARHLPLIVVMLAYFAGLVAGFVFWYFTLPSQESSQLFAIQLNEINAINAQFSGYAINAASSLATDAVAAFETIFLHNMQVLVLVVVLSILYGAGSVFILSWNASVIAVFIGGVAKQFVLHAPGESILTGIGIGAMGLVPHGTFELLSYSAGALAGGILSSSLIKKTYLKPGFVIIVNDIAKLTAWAVIFLAIGALLESGAIG
ncbi:MAG: hypothetical protein NTY90_01470 [Candidatus Micrarchaeota archaeon]|nr:hypothetical protein [Candidatus Micrarchaeota archaeon]